MSEVELSIIAPVYNEAGVLEELASRCSEAGRATGKTYEVLLVDDCSTDATADLAQNIALPVRVVHLSNNLGQLGATLHGLRVAKGKYRVVLDGDLQDPPEVIPELLAALTDTAEVVFAVKRTREDPLWFRMGRGVYGLLTRVPGARSMPAGAGSFCVMRGELAERVAAMPTRWGNLASLVVLATRKHAVVEYDKLERPDGDSRVGFFGLVREAIWSLSLTGALAAWSFWLTVVLVVLGLLLPVVAPPLFVAAAGTGVATALLKVWSHRLRSGGAEAQP